MPTLSESELLIMQWVWANSAPFTAAKICAAFAPTRGWKSQTVNTFLTRLVEKGILSAERRGTQNQYTPLVTDAQYRAGQTRSFVDEMHGGSVKNLLAALYDAKGLEASELDELKRWLETR